MCGFFGRALARLMLSLMVCVCTIALAEKANAQAYLETGQSGAQTQIDVNHTTTMYIGAVATFNFGGAHYNMKSGSASNADVTFTVYPNSACTGSPLATVVQPSTAFTQTYATVPFEISGGLTLNPGIYCTKLTSPAVDQQNEAFFIKGFDACVVLPADQANGAVCSTTMPTIAPNLTIAKSAPSPSLVVGSQSSYTLTVTNSGNLAATTAQVKDQLPTSLSLVSATGTGWSCTNASGLVTCNFSGSIAASGGTSSVTLTVVPNAGTGGQSVTNYASVDPTGGTSPPTPGPTCSPTTSCASSPSATIQAPNLTIAKAAPTPALNVGQQSTYILTVTNNGTAAATTAQVKDQLPTGLTFVSASGTGWSCTNASGLVTCNYSGSIAGNGGTSTVNIVVRTTSATVGQSIVNHASIDPTGGPNPPTPGPTCTTAGSCALSSSTVSSPNLVISMANPAPALEIGARSTYVLTVANRGNAASMTARVQNDLPAGLAFVAASGTGWSCGNAGNSVTCDYSGSPLAANGGASVISVVAMTTAAAATAVAIVNAAAVDATGGTNPPTPGPACAPTTSCAAVSAAVGTSKRRTEAIVHNFMAKRADRIASNGLALNRLVDRLADETCNEGDVPSSRAPTVAPSPFATAPQGVPSPGSTQAFGFGGGLAGSLPRTGSMPPVTDAENLSMNSSGPGIGVVAAGTQEQGRMSVATSLQEIRRNQAAADQRRTGRQLPDNCIERRQKARFDIWFDGALDFFRYATSQGQMGLLKVGVDYKIAPGLLMGAMLQVDRTQEKSEQMGYLVKGNGWMAGPYAAMRLGSNFYFDTRFLWGRSENDVSPYLTYTDSFSTQRWLAAARLSGRWNWGNLAVTPSVEYIHFEEKSGAYVSSQGIGIDSQKVSINRVLFGPEFRYRTDLDRNTALGLHFAVKGIWDANPTAMRSLEDGTVATDRKSDFHVRFDAGTSVTFKSGVSAEVGVGYEGLGGDGFSSKTISSRLKVPLN